MFRGDTAKFWQCLYLGEEGWLWCSCGSCARWVHFPLTRGFCSLSRMLCLSVPIPIKRWWVGFSIKHSLPRYCKTSFIIAGKVLGVDSAPGMRRCILRSADVLGREGKLHRSWYSPWCALSPPASPSTSLQPGRPRFSAILYGLPKKQIIMHCKMKLAF